MLKKMYAMSMMDIRLIVDMFGLMMLSHGCHYLLHMSHRKVSAFSTSS